MKKVRLGVVNYYNPGDGLLSAGTMLMGNVDGIRDAGAGLNGFRNPASKLYQIRIHGNI